MADLTVIVPTHNGSNHVGATLASLHAQRGADLEVVVVDDGSTDDTALVAERHPLRPRVVVQANHGVAVARNRGLAEASARWVAFLDQDDLWHPDRASILLELADRTGASAVATTEQAFALESDRRALQQIGDGRELWPSQWISAGSETDVLLASELGGSDEVEMLTLQRFMEAPATLTTTLMYDRIAAIAAGGCATFVRAADDHVLNVAITRMLGDVPRINRPCLFYRVHPHSTTTSSPLVVPYLTTLLALRHGRSLPSDPVASAYVDHLLSQLHQTTLTSLEQAALLVLSTERTGRLRRFGGWAKRRSRLAVRLD